MSLEQVTLDLLRNEDSNVLIDATIFAYDVMNLSDSDAELSDEDQLMEQEESGEEEVHLFLIGDHDHEKVQDIKDTNDSKKFRQMLSKEQMEQVVCELEHITKFSTRYNFTVFNQLFEGETLLNYLLTNCQTFSTLCESDALLLSNELVRKGLILDFPPRIGTSRFARERVYRLPPSVEQRALNEISSNLNYVNYDFWVCDLLHSFKTSSTQKGLRFFNDSFKAQQLIQHLLHNVFASEIECSLFVEKLFDEGLLKNCANPESTEFKPQNVYKFERELIKSLLPSGVFRADLCPSFIEGLSSPDFSNFFCRLSNDSAVLMAVLSVISPQSFIDPSSPQHTLYELVVQHSWTMKNSVLRAFELNDIDAQALAVDLYWEVLKLSGPSGHLCRNTLECPKCSRIDKEFVEFSKIYLSGPRGTNPPVRSSLIAALLDYEWSLQKPIPLNQRVVRPGLWKAYFYFVNGSTPEMLEASLRDMFSLIIDNPDNVSDLVAQDWVSWFLPYLQLGARFSDSILFIVSIMSHVLVQSLLHLEQFPGVLRRFLEVLEQRSAENNYQKLSFNVLNMVVAKVGQSQSKFPLSFAKESTPWANVLSLCSFIRDFVFSSGRWEEDLSSDEELLGVVEGFQRDLDTCLYLFEETKVLLSGATRMMKELRVDSSSECMSNGKSEKLFLEESGGLFSTLHNGIGLVEVLEDVQSKGVCIDQSMAKNIVKQYLCRTSDAKRILFVEKNLKELLQE